MKRNYRLEGLDCADCAAKLERKLASVKGMQSAAINFMTLKCMIEAEDDKIDDVVKEAMKIIAREEPDVEVKQI